MKDFDMIFHFKAVQNFVAEHCEIDFDMIFHFKATQNLLAERKQFSTLRWTKTWLQSTMK